MAVSAASAEKTVVRLRAALAIIALALGSALASEVSPQLRTLIEDFQAHRRVAVGYLRTNNVDLAAFEVERLRDRWAADVKKIPQELRREDLNAAVAQIETAVQRALQAADKGDLEQARVALEGADELLTAWRKANGLRLFSDCIVEANSVYERFDSHRLRPPDLTSPVTASAVIAAASAALAAIARCDGEAPAAIRSEPEFRRLVDGMTASLRQVPDAVSRRDGPHLHRLLIEQRSFARLLLFRFG